MEKSMVSDDDATVVAGACCNVVVWDILIATITSGFLFAKFVHIHWALSIILGIIAGVFIGFLMMIRFLGTVIQFGFSIVWCIGIEEILEKIFGIYKYIDKESIKMWAIRAGAVLIIFGIHLLCNLILTGTCFGVIGEDLSENIKFRRERHKQKSHNEKKIRKKKRDICYDKLEQEIREVYLYKKKLDDINDKISKMVEKNVINMEEWEKIYDCVFVKTANIYNGIVDEKKYYSARPKKRCKEINSVITDIHSKRIQIEKNIEYMEQNILIFEKRIEEEERERCKQKEDYSNQEESYDDKKEDYNYSHKLKHDNDSHYILFFAGCNDIESFRKRYKDLAKIYHPDNPNGDEKIFQEIQNIYEIICSEL